MNALVNYIEKVRYALLPLIAFVLPISKKAIPVLIIFYVISWAFSGNLKERIMRVTRGEYLFLFTSFYLLHIVGMLYSDNIGFGLFDLEIKLSLLVLPIVIATGPELSSEQFKQVLNSFIIGCIAAVLLCLSRGLYLYIDSGDIAHLLYGDLAYLHHSTYFSMYLCLAICIILYYALGDKYKLTNRYRWIAGLLLILFSGFIFLLSSKSGLIMLALIILMSIFHLIFIKKFYKIGAVIVIGTTILLGIGLKTSPHAIKRFQYIPGIVFADTEIDKTTTESIAVRVLIWPQAIKIIKENFLLGVGTGDIKDELLKKYEAEGMTGVLERRSNTHNQFLQTFAALGIFGFLSLLLVLLLPFYFSIKKSRYLFALFLLIIVVNSLTESILEVQAGVVFYAFFNSIFMFLEPDE